MKWFLLLILNSFEWCICRLQSVTKRERFLGDGPGYLEKMFGTFNRPVQFILSHQMEVNNFLIALTSASISKGQPGLSMLFWCKRTILFMISWNVKTSVLKAGKLSLCKVRNSGPLWFAVICRGPFWGIFLLILAIMGRGWIRQDWLCMPFYRWRQRVREIMWLVKGHQTRTQAVLGFRSGLFSHRIPPWTPEFQRIILYSRSVY